MDSASLFRLFLLAAIWGGSFLFMRIGVPVFGPAGLLVLAGIAQTSGFVNPLRWRQT